MNKFSIRKQIKNLKEEYNALIKKDSSKEESSTRIKKLEAIRSSLFNILDDIIDVTILKKKTRKHSSNSGNRNKKNGTNEDQKKPARRDNIRDT